MGEKVTVVGSFAVGMTIRSPVMPAYGQTLLGGDFDMGPGGKGSNQAVAARRLGAQTALVANIGNDALGGIATELYRAEGVDRRHLRELDDRTTGVGFIILNSAGDNFIILDMGANETLSPADVDAAAETINDSRVVMAVLEIPLGTAQRAMELGQECGAITILNPAPARLLPPEIFAHVDVLTPNESELRILLGLRPDDRRSSRELARELRAQGVRTVVVTLGGKGALVLTEDIDLMVPAPAVDVVDTTGAGDAFNAGLAVALSEGRDLVSAVRFAVCAGAHACTQLGVVPALGHRHDIDRLEARQTREEVTT